MKALWCHIHVRYYPECQWIAYGLQKQISHSFWLKRQPSNFKNPELQPDYQTQEWINHYRDTKTWRSGSSWSCPVLVDPRWRNDCHQVKPGSVPSLKDSALGLELRGFRRGSCWRQWTQSGTLQIQKWHLDVHRIKSKHTRAYRPKDTTFFQIHLLLHPQQMQCPIPCYAGHFYFYNFMLMPFLEALLYLQKLTHS